MKSYFFTLFFLKKHDYFINNRNSCAFFGNFLYILPVFDKFFKNSYSITNKICNSLLN